MSRILFIERFICNFEDKFLPFSKRFAADNRFGTMTLDSFCLLYTSRCV